MNQDEKNRVFANAILDLLGKKKTDYQTQVYLEAISRGEA